MRRETRDWRPGEILLGLYTVLDVVKSGGMGLVYRVRHRGWDVDLAVKTPRPERLPSSKARQQFETEAQAWVGLGLHPHTVNCAYVRRIDDIPRVFAEWVDGGSLDEAVRTGRLYEGGPEDALQRILDVAVQTAWGLAHAHDSGLVHQDVKPANIMLEQDWTAKVTDFGLAGGNTSFGTFPTSPAHRESNVRDVTFGGLTEPYCSPEQADAAAGDRSVRLTRATDVWSWALTVLTMFAGGRPTGYGQTAAETFEVILDAGPRNACIPRIPSAVEELLRQCFLTNPADRSYPFSDKAAAVIAAYESSVGAPYQRTVPKSAYAADTLSNHALSLLDLGRAEEAEQLWREARSIDPHHGPTVYNSGLHLWRAGRMEDGELVSELEAARAARSAEWRDAYLLGLVHLELDDPEAAAELLNEAVRGVDPRPDEVAAALTEAESRPEPLAPTTLKGHADDITAVALTGDGTRALTGTEGGELWLWDTRAGRCLSKLSRGGAPIRAIAMDDAGSVALIARGPHSEELFGARLREQLVEVWRLTRGRRGKHLHYFDHPHAALTALAISGDGLQAAAGYSNGVYRLCDLTHLSRAAPTGPNSAASRDAMPITSLALSHHGDVVLAASTTRQGHGARTWYATTGQVIAEAVWPLQHRELSRDLLAVSRDAGAVVLIERILTQQGGQMTLWNGRISHVTAQLPYQHEKVLVVGPRGDVALTGGGGSPVRLWEVRTGRCLRTLHVSSSGGFAGSIGPVAMSSDGRVALIATYDEAQVRSLPSSGYQAPWEYVRPRPVAEIARAADVFTATLERAERLLQDRRPQEAVAELRTARSIPGFERHPDLRDAWSASGRHGRRAGLLGAWPSLTLNGHRSFTQPVTLALSGDSALLAIGHRTGEVSLCATGGGEQLHVFPRGRGMPESLHLTDSDRTLHCVTRAEGLRTLDVHSGRERRHLGHAGQVHAVAFAGDRLLTGDGAGVVRVFERGGERLVRTLEAHAGRVESVAVSPDGRYAATLGDAGKAPDSKSSFDTFEIHVWDLTTGRRMWSIGNRARRNLMRFAAGGRVLCVSGFPYTEAWDVDSGRHSYTVRGSGDFMDMVGAWGHAPLAVSADGRLGVSSDYTSGLLVWRTDTGRVLRSLRQGRNLSECFAFTEDGRVLVTAGAHGAVLVWDLESGELLRTLRGHTAEISSLTLSRDGSTLVTGDLDSKVWVWQLDWDIAFSPPDQDWIERLSATAPDQPTSRNRRRWFRRG